MREKDVDFFTVNSGLKASVVERFNRTLKDKMCKYFTAKNTLTYIHVLHQLVSSCKNTYHRSIKMNPSQVTKANGTVKGEILCMVMALKRVSDLNFK